MEIESDPADHFPYHPTGYVSRFENLAGGFQEAFVKHLKLPAPPPQADTALTQNALTALEKTSSGPKRSATCFSQSFSHFFKEHLSGPLQENQVALFKHIP